MQFNYVSTVKKKVRVKIVTGDFLEGVITRTFDDYILIKGLDGHVLTVNKAHVVYLSLLEEPTDTD